MPACSGTGGANTSARGDLWQVSRGTATARRGSGQTRGVFFCNQAAKRVPGKAPSAEPRQPVRGDARGAGGGAATPRPRCLCLGTPALYLPRQTSPRALYTLHSHLPLRRLLQKVPDSEHVSHARGVSVAAQGVGQPGTETGTGGQQGLGLPASCLAPGQWLWSRSPWRDSRSAHEVAVVRQLSPRERLAPWDDGGCGRPVALRRHRAPGPGWH